MRVDFINQFTAHYRRPVFSELSGFSGLQIRTLTGPTSLEGGIPSADLQALPITSRTDARCRSLVGRINWQRGIVGNALRSDAEVIVYTGDVTCLSTWIAAAVTRVRRRSCLMWTHGWTHRDHGAVQAVRNTFYGLADALLVYSPDAIAFGRENGFNKHIYVVGNSMGAQVTRMAPPAGEAHTPQRWLVMSRLIESRQIDEVIRQAGRLNRLGRAVEVTIVGDGPGRGALEQLSRDLNVDAYFHGSEYDATRTQEFLESHDIVVSPGHVGLAAVHALSHGCPVSTHDRVDHQMPEHSAVIPARTGVRFPHEDWDAMGEQTWDFVATSDLAAVAEACMDEVRRRWTPSAHASAIHEAIISEHQRSGGSRARAVLPWTRTARASGA